MLRTAQLMTMPPGTVLPSQVGVWPCTVQVDDKLADAYVKLVPKYQIVREVLCALIAQAVGLPSLRPGVVQLHAADLDTSESFAFATLAVEQHHQPRMRDDSVLRAQLSRWPHLALAIAFDEWIANADRTIGNMLFRGVGDFVLIDHGEAIPSGLAADGPVTNRLARLAYPDVSRDEERSAVHRVQQAAVVFNDVDLKAIETASLAGHWDPDGMLRECSRFVADRLIHLNDLIAQSFGVQQRTLTLQPRQGE